MVAVDPDVGVDVLEGRRDEIHRRRQTGDAAEVGGEVIAVVSEHVPERRLRDEGATLEALGEKLGISKERVRQIESRALEKLKTALVKNNRAFEASLA